MIFFKLLFNSIMKFKNKKKVVLELNKYKKKDFKDEVLILIKDKNHKKLFYHDDKEMVGIKNDNK